MIDATDTTTDDTLEVEAEEQEVHDDITEASVEVAEPAEVADEAAEPDPQPEDDGPTRKARKDAARYREQLRTVETRANAMRDQLIEHELGVGNVKLAALTAAGVDLDTLFTEDGRVSAEAVQAAAETARETLGISNNRFQGSADQGAGRLASPAAPSPSWGSLLG